MESTYRHVDRWDKLRGVQGNRIWCDANDCSLSEYGFIVRVLFYGVLYGSSIVLNKGCPVRVGLVRFGRLSDHCHGEKKLYFGR